MRARRIQVVLTAGAGLALVALALVPGSPSRARATSSPWLQRETFDDLRTLEVGEADSG